MPKISTESMPRRISEALHEFMPESFGRKGGAAVSCEADSESNGYEIFNDASGALAVKHASVSDLMMALGDILSGDIPSGRQEPRFDFRGVMLDCSRNGIPKVEFIKDALVRMALMGLNHLCLYTEDTYEIDGEPCIGFGRGRYSKAELRGLDRFAASIGVTMFPCIQTLGHMEHVFKYAKYAGLMDNNRVFNVCKEESYEFVERLIRNASEPYASKLIHLGTDEPWGIGRGKALDFERPVKPGLLFAKHAGRLAGICERLGLEGMIWGDYVLGHSGDKALSAEESGIMPKSLVMDYWNYTCSDRDVHLKNIAAYKAMGYDVLVSPGIWNWNRFWGNSEYAAETTLPFLDAAADSGVRRAMMTMWGDDGQEALFDSNWDSIAMFLSSCRLKSPSGEFRSRRLASIAGFSAETCSLAGRMENSRLDGGGGSDRSLCVSKPLLYDDPLLCYAGKCFKDDAPFKHFMKMEESFREAKAETPREGRLKRLAASYAKLIALKYRLSRQSRAAYLKGDKKALKRSLRLLPDVERELRKFRELYRAAWLSERKPFGYEVIDARLGGLQARLDSFRHAIRSFLEGASESIPEFELENPDGMTIGIMPTYAKVSSRNHNAIWV